MNAESIQIQKVVALTICTTMILKNLFNSKQIIQILQPIIIDNFSTHPYIVDIS